MKKSFLILFSDAHLAYSPFTINLFYCLKSISNVKLITFHPSVHYSLQKINDPDVIYINDYPTKLNLLNRIKRKISSSYRNAIKLSLLSFRAQSLINFIEQLNFNGEIIAVDFFCLWCALQVKKSAHLISLEIIPDDPYKKACDTNSIKSVVIQSEERYKELFGNKNLQKFIIQNAPPFIEFEVPINTRSKNDLIFCGSALPSFGIFSCLDFLMDYPEYRLTIKGAIPPVTKDAINKFYYFLLEEKRLILDEEYLDNENLTLYISKFRIGFVFYDFYRFEERRKFNYFTAPSGKMFQYFNSNVPVIGNHCEGLKIIEQYGAGKLISSLGSRAIKNAIDEIENNYEIYVKNAKEVAKIFDFNKNIQPYIEFLMQ
jgi:hypothetical protein